MPDAPSYLKQRELARRWRVSGRTLERWRAQFYGPAWVNIGGSIRYPLNEIEDFESRHRNATAQYGGTDGPRGGAG